MCGETGSCVPVKVTQELVDKDTSADRHLNSLIPLG
jgi:hypothetical protein